MIVLVHVFYIYEYMYGYCTQYCKYEYQLYSRTPNLQLKMITLFRRYLV